MACRILRAPVLAQSIYKSAPNVNLCLFNSSWLGASQAGNLCLSQKRGYKHYLTSGEMAALQDPADGSVFLEEPEYPDILDMSKEGVALRARQASYEEIKRMPTAHHKMLLLNIERGRERMFYVGDLHYNSLEAYQYATRTVHKMEVSASDTEEGTADPALVSLIQEALLTNRLMTNSTEQAAQSRELCLIQSILDAIRYHCKLHDTEILAEPRIEAFWQHSNFKTNLDEEIYEDQENFAPYFQFRQSAQLMLSSETPLQPIIDAQSEEIFKTDQLQTYDYYPEELGFYCKMDKLVSTPGYWCNAFLYPLLTTSPLEKVLPSSLDPSVNTDHLNSSERRRRLAAHGLMMNFATTVGTASNCGFTPFHEITYPFVSQHVVTDGQTWHFSKYQLNTMAFGPDLAKDKLNFAWSSEEMKLYDSIENGQVHGLNTSVLSRIVRTLQAPRQAVEDPRPYTDLGVEKDFLERGEAMFKDSAARKFHYHEHAFFDIPLWAKIYKIHKDAPPTPNIYWDRPRARAPRIVQFNKEIYNQECEAVRAKFRKVARDKLFGLRPMYRVVKPRGAMEADKIFVQ